MKPLHRAQPCVCAVLAALLLAACTSERSTQQRMHRAQMSMSSVSPFVDPGSDTEAVQYYKRVQARLQFPLLDAANAPSASLDGLLAWLGLQGLSAADLESIESATLMPADQAQYDKLASKVQDKTSFTSRLPLGTLQDDKILVSRFFAPKIVDYGKAPPYVPGWRKLVNLRAQPQSQAEAAGIGSAYVLFNYVKADVSIDPFANNVSKNNQVLLVPKVAAANEDALYFMVFLQAPDYRLGLALDGVAFDLPATLPPGGKYFVPGSCAQCHGHDARSGDLSPRPADGIFRAARLNYLDSDQWHDALDFDFPQLKSSGHAVVFDGGNDPSAPAFKAAMNVMRKLNQGVHAQNASVDPGDFKTKSVDKWLTNHATSDARVPQELRFLDTGGGVWDAKNADEMALLSSLNHFCFRCHSSVRYHVFDKGGVADASIGFEGRLTQPATSPRYMPQGRELDAAERNRIIELTSKVFP